MISSYTREVWKTRKSGAVILLSHRRTFDLFFSVCAMVWSGTEGSERWNDTWQILCLASQCSLSFFHPLFLSVSWHLMCASHSPGLWFLMLCIAAEWETVKFFSFHSICFSYFSSLCVCVSYSIWLDSLCFVYVCTVSDLMCVKKIHKNQ